MGSKARRRELAQYFTPQVVARFAFDALQELGFWTPRPRVIDPACGEGVFVAEAARQLPEAHVWGCDVDRSLLERWRQADLERQGVRLLIQDGLADAPEAGIEPGAFDLVIGNPPYGLGLRRPVKGESIESAFVRRFADLARKGGWLAVVVPEGILANERSRPLREWLLDRVAPRGVVSLPETTFAAAGTRARTALLFAQKGGEPNGEVLMAASLGNCRGKSGLSRYLARVLANIREHVRRVPSGRHRRP